MVDTWRKFYSLRGMTIPDKKKKIKDLVQCGAASIQPKTGSQLPRIKGLESVRKWQKSFFYVKNKSRTEDFIRLPSFRLGVPSRARWRAAVTETAETQMIDNRVEALTKEIGRASCRERVCLYV